MGHFRMSDISRLEVLKMRHLRSICGLHVMDRVPNFDILKRCSIRCVSSIVNFRRLRWLGHVTRMGDDRLPKLTMFCDLRGTGKRGRPVKGWNDYGRQDLESLGILLTWWKKRQDRPSWRAIIETLL